MRKDFLRVIRNPITFFGETVIDRAPVLSISWDSEWKRVSNPEANLFYRAYEVNLRWPILLQLQLHIARYPLGGRLTEHADWIVPGERQYRVQFILENAEEGGVLECERFIVNRRRFKVFEPARYRHAVTEVKRGERRLLNFGIRFSLKPIRPCPF